MMWHCYGTRKKKFMGIVKCFHLTKILPKLFECSMFVPVKQLTPSLFLGSHIPLLYAPKEKYFLFFSFLEYQSVAIFLFQRVVIMV